jgi:hypothetical protein
MAGRSDEGLRGGILHVRELLDTLAQDASEADRRRRALYSTVIHSLRLRAATDPFRQETRQRISEARGLLKREEPSAGRIALSSRPRLLSHPRARRALRMPSTDHGRDVPSPRLSTGYAQLQYQPVGEHRPPSAGGAARAARTHNWGTVRGCTSPVRTSGGVGASSRPDTISTFEAFESSSHSPCHHPAHAQGSGRLGGLTGSPRADSYPHSSAWHASPDRGAAWAAEIGPPGTAYDASLTDRACQDGAWDMGGMAARGGDTTAACGEAGCGAAEGSAWLLRTGSTAGISRARGGSGAVEAWDGCHNDFLPPSMRALTPAVGPAQIAPLGGESSVRQAAILRRRRRWWYKPVAVLGGRYFSVSRGLGLQFILGKRMVSEHLEPPAGERGKADPPPVTRGFLVYECAARALAAAVVGRRSGKLAAAPVAVLRVSGRGECAPPSASWPSPDGAWAFRVLIPEGVALERQVRRGRRS